MGKFFDEIPEELIPWIEEQHVFWVATAPLSSAGHVNLSPKGYQNTFKLLGRRSCFYQDLSGSGNETISHLYENGRITIMFNAFEGAPRILRLFGKGTVYERGSSEFDKLVPPDEILPGARAVIVIDIHKVGTSCGFSVPFFTFEGPRMQLQEFFSKKEDLDNASSNGYSPLGLRSYWCDKNAESIDGLPGMKFACKTAGPVGNGVGLSGRTYVGKILSERDGRLVLLAAFTGGYLLSNLWSLVSSRASMLSSLFNYP